MSKTQWKQVLDTVWVRGDWAIEDCGAKPGRCFALYRDAKLVYTYRTREEDQRGADEREVRL